LPLTSAWLPRRSNKTTLTNTVGTQCFPTSTTRWPFCSCLILASCCCSSSVLLVLLLLLLL
jgi:hypothetical protein